MSKEQEIHIRRADVKSQFTVLSNLMIWDSRLSVEAKGLLIYIQSLPPDFLVSKSVLIKYTRCKRFTMDRIFDELREAGYLYETDVLLRKAGKFEGKVYTFYGISQKGIQTDGLCKIEGTDAGEQHRTDVGGQHTFVGDQQRTDAGDQQLINTKYKKEIYPPTIPQGGQDVVKPAREKKTFVPPTFEELNSYLVEKGINDYGFAKKIFDHYNNHDWKDSKGTKVQNWKQKLQTNWISNYSGPKGNGQPLPPVSTVITPEEWDTLPDVSKGVEFYMDTEPHKPIKGNMHLYHNHVGCFPDNTFTIVRKFRYIPG